MQRKTYRYLTLLMAGSLVLGAIAPSAIAVPLQPVPAQAVSASRALPWLLGRRVKQEISKAYKVPVNQLRITASQPRTWDACLGLAAPQTVCAQIAISGWQVILESPQSRWVYHISSDGKRGGLNQAASVVQSAEPVSIQFLSEEQIVATSEDDVLFKTVDQGGFAGRTVITLLTRDGVISRQQVGPTLRSRPVVVRRLTPKQLETFLNRMESTRFNNLKTLRYLPGQPAADFITTQINFGGAVVEYADFTQAQLPVTLQQVIQAWQQVAK
jgi:hypothetical protein